MKRLVVAFAHRVARVAVRRDDGAEHDDAVARQQLGHEADARHVGATVLRRQAEVGGEALAHDVAVEHLDLSGPSSMNFFSSAYASVVLPDGRKTSEPDRCALRYVAHSDSPISATYGPVSS